MPFTYKEDIAGWRWYDIKSVSSTNDAIKELINEETKNVVISAIRQTKGRGRRGRAWQGFDGNLYFTYSYLIDPAELSRYVCLIGLALALTVKSLLPAKKVEIKWPNDIFLEGRKLSGILLENIKDNLWAIGIGVNIIAAPNLINQPYAAISLKECGITLDRTDFLKYYLETFDKIIKQYRKEGFLALKEQWLSSAKGLAKEVSLKTEQGIKTGIFLTLDDNGYLLLKTDTGTERIIAGDLFA